MDVNKQTAFLLVSIRRNTQTSLMEQILIVVYTVLEKVALDV